MTARARHQRRDRGASRGPRANQSLQRTGGQRWFVVECSRRCSGVVLPRRLVRALERRIPRGVVSESGEPRAPDRASQEDSKPRHGPTVRTCWIAYGPQRQGLPPRLAPNSRAATRSAVPRDHVSGSVHHRAFLRSNQALQRTRWPAPLSCRVSWREELRMRTCRDATTEVSSAVLAESPCWPGGGSRCSQGGPAVCSIGTRPRPSACRPSPGASPARSASSGLWSGAWGTCGRPAQPAHLPSHRTAARLDAS
jgi:hypothetical protein